MVCSDMRETELLLHSLRLIIALEIAAPYP